MTKTPALLSCVLAAGLSAQQPCPPVQTIETFEGGTNAQGWNFGVGVPDVIVPVGGNPGSFLGNNGIVSFAPILTTTPKAAGRISGDFRALGITRISFDAKTDLRSFGTPAGFTMSLVLRDTKGTQTVQDDDFVSFAGSQVPQIGEGWKNFDYAVPSSSTTLPTGWRGGSGIEPIEFRPGVDWNDVITNVDSVEFWWIDMGFQAIIVSWAVGVDNVVFEQSGDARAVVRNGNGSNPLTLSAGTLPVLGANWDTVLDCSGHGAGFAGLFGAPGSTSGIFTPFGELLFDPTGALTFAVVAVSPGQTTFSFVLPNDPVLCGFQLAMQGLCTGLPSPQMSNALDVTLGH